MNSLSKTVTRQRCDCDLNPGPSVQTVPESSTLTTWLPSHPRTSEQNSKILQSELLKNEPKESEYVHKHRLWDRHTFLHSGNTLHCAKISE